MAKIRARLEKFTYKRILRFIKFPKSRQFTEADKKTARKSNILQCFSNFPQRVLLVLEPTDTESLATRVNKLSEIRLHSYWPFIDYEIAQEVNESLGGDPLLQKMHADFINEMENAENPKAPIMGCLPPS